MEVKIYHNPRCSKSREALEVLTANNIKPVIIKYLEVGVTAEEVLVLSKQLSKNVIEFVRKKEAEFDKNEIDWSDNCIAAKKLSECPKLLERPIIIKNGQAIIARPMENLLNFIC